MGRPLLLAEPGVRDKLMTAIRSGARYNDAAAYAGMDAATLYRYLGFGRAEHRAIANGADPNPEKDIYLRFYEDCLEANGQIALHAVTLWRAQMATDWRACRDFLTARFGHWRPDGTVPMWGDEDDIETQDRSLSEGQARLVADSMRLFSDRLLALVRKDGEEVAARESGRLARQTLIDVATREANALDVGGVDASQNGTEGGAADEGADPDGG